MQKQVAENTKAMKIIPTLEDKIKQQEQKQKTLEERIRKQEEEQKGKDKKIKELQDKINKIEQSNHGNGQGEAVEKILTDLKEETEKGQERINEMEQYSRNRNFEIQNIPETANEKVEDIVIRTCDRLGVLVTHEHIEACHRIPLRNKNRIAPIIVQVKSRKLRDEILESRTEEIRTNGKIEKRKKQITQDDIIGNGNEKDLVYIRENLTPFYRNLEILTKKIAKTHNGYKFVWFNNGKLFIRKDDKEKAIRIKNENDLEKIFGRTALEQGKEIGRTEGNAGRGMPASE